MATLCLRLVAPLQSWGISSRFGERDSAREPSKSGVIGLVCAALGRDRTASVDDLVALRMGVRVDAPGQVIRDYHTALDVPNASGKGHDTVLTQRYYLADAAFWVGLEGGTALLEQVHEALQRPRWPIFLGRKACVPSLPLWADGALTNLGLVDALAGRPFLGRGDSPDTLRVLLEDEAGDIVRQDQPIAPYSVRRFGPRRIRQETVACTSPASS